MNFAEAFAAIDALQNEEQVEAMEEELIETAVQDGLLQEETDLADVEAGLEDVSLNLDEDLPQEDDDTE